MHSLNIVNPVNFINRTDLKGVEFELTQVTPEVAEQWLRENIGNRNKRKRNVDAIRRDIISGSFLFTGDPIRFDWNGRLIDGQHRLEAIIAAGAPVVVLVIRGLDPKVQGVLDRNARRTAADALRFAGVETNSPVVAAASRIGMGADIGYSADSRDGRVVDPTNPEVERWVHENPDIIEATALGVKYADRLGITKAVATYIALRFMRIDFDAAVEFLDTTAFLQTAGQGDPRFALIEAIKRESRTVKGSRSRVHQAGTINLFFRAWNSWRSGKTVGELKTYKYKANENGTRISVGIKTPEPK